MWNYVLPSNELILDSDKVFFFDEDDWPLLSFVFLLFSSSFSFFSLFVSPFLCLRLKKSKLPAVVERSSVTIASICLKPPCGGFHPRFSLSWTWIYFFLRKNCGKVLRNARSLQNYLEMTYRSVLYVEHQAWINNLRMQGHEY